MDVDSETDASKKGILTEMDTLARKAILPKYFISPAERGLFLEWVYSEEQILSFWSRPFFERAFV